MNKRFDEVDSRFDVIDKRLDNWKQILPMLVRMCVWFMRVASCTGSAGN